jgi:hypothetical protein
LKLLPTLLVEVFQSRISQSQAISAIQVQHRKIRATNRTLKQFESIFIVCILLCITI